MKEAIHHQIPLLLFENLAAEPDLMHGITQRKGGISENFASGLNLSYTVGDNPDHVRCNRNLLAGAMEVPADRLIFPRQTHSANVKVITEENYHETTDDTDAVVTCGKNLALAVMSADCVPVLLYDKQQKVIAAIHAGWKGTVNGIVRNALRVMQNEFNCQPENILAGIGPSICAANYEVGPEVVEMFQRTFDNAGKLLSDFKEGHARVNLWEANKTWLTGFGVPEKNIEISGICTFSHPELFFSARYSKNHTGRFAGVIKLV